MNPQGPQKQILLSCLTLYVKQILACEMGVYCAELHLTLDMLACLRGSQTDTNVAICFIFWQHLS